MKLKIRMELEFNKIFISGIYWRLQEEVCIWFSEVFFNFLYMMDNKFNII